MVGYARAVADRQFERACRRLASTVKRRRVELGLTQEEAADAMEIAVRHYQKLEAAEVNVTLRTLCRIAIALRLELSDLLRS
jgi:transcriptional regulator with XRE-family HTH domain